VEQANSDSEQSASAFCASASMAVRIPQAGIQAISHTRGLNHHISFCFGKALTLLSVNHILVHVSA